MTNAASKVTFYTSAQASEMSSDRLHSGKSFISKTNKQEVLITLDRCHTYNKGHNNRDLHRLQ